MLRLPRRFQALSKAASAITMMAATLVLAGWLLHIDALRSLLPGWVPMPANAAVGVLLAGLALWLLQKETPATTPDIARRRLARVCTLGVGLISTLTLAQYLFGWDLALDQLLVREPPRAAGTVIPGRMAPNTALSLLAIGCALWLLDRGRYRLAQSCAVVAAAIGMLALFGHAYGVDSLSGLGAHTHMALPTALTLVVLAAGLLLARPDRGLMRIFVGEGAGGVMARWLVLPILVVPVGLDVLALAVQRAGLIDSGVTPIIHAVLVVGILEFLALATFGLLERTDTERKQAHAMLHESEARYRGLFEANPHPMWVYDLETLAFLEVNDAAVAHYGYQRDEFLAMTIADIRPADDVERLLADIAYVVVDAMDKGSVWRHRKKDGSIIDVEITAHTFDHGGRRARLVLVHDVTERKRAELTLRRSYDLLDQTGRLAKVGGWQLDVDTQTLYWTEDVYRIHEVDSAIQPSVAEAIEFYAPEARPVIAAAVQTAIDAGTPFDLELPLVTAQGRRIWVRAQGTAERRGGKTIRVYGAFQDITERKLAADALVAKEAYVRAIMNNVPYLMWLKDRDGRFLTVNDLFARSCGRESAEEVIGKTDLDVWPADLANKYRSDDAEVMATRTQKKTEELIAEQDGTKWFETFKTSILDANGELIGTTGVAQDITERRVAEESRRLQSAALQAAADAIVITDRAGVIEWVNPSFAQLTGYTAEEALGKNPRDLVKSGKHDQAFFKDLWDTILAGRTWRGDMVNRRKDGGLYTERQAVTPIRDASGAITHFVAIKNDITERLQLEAQFRQAQKMESVGQLASGIAHDFNNLLTVINGMSDLLLAQISHDDPVHGDVQEILHAGERAATLTRQLLAFSRQQILEPRVLSLNTVVAGMEGLLRRVLGEDINLVVMPAPDLGRVKADPGQIEQVISNLAVNARDAMPQGGRLTIETQNVEIDEDYARQHGVATPPGSYVRLTVTDSGVGMDEATRTRIFEPFFTTKGPGKGTGLGLSTVYGIVKQSHGFIWVYSEVGRGTSFKIYLPQVTEAAATEELRPSVGSSAGTETILLVEDNAGLRKLATRVLAPAGYTVLGAATGDEALHLLEHREAPVHLLLSDVVMPGMNGRELAEQLGQTRPGMKVLYMSGYTSDTIVRHGVLEAEMPFLNKPFTAVTLLRKVREVLDS